MARYCLVPSCPEAERTQGWWPGHWVLEPGREFGSADWSVSSCLGSWRKSGDGTTCGYEGVVMGASELTGCGGSEDLEERKEKQPSVPVDSSLRNSALERWVLQSKALGP